MNLLDDTGFLEKTLEDACRYYESVGTEPSDKDLFIFVLDQLEDSLQKPLSNADQSKLAEALGLSHI